jgi:tRNA 2-selenouridine synthase
MIVQTLLPNLLEISSNIPILDVRSQAEFVQGHIPGAVNLPLLNNEERSIVGTLYKQKGNNEAVVKGFELVGGKFAEYILQAKSLAVENTISVYCWRGGMRSNIMAWLLSTAGLHVNLLKGGYKTFRNEVLSSFTIQRNLLILGGKTGSGKTEMLQHLKANGEQVLDLEALAHHRGSAFGALGQIEQPSNELFENEIFMQIKNTSASRPLWIENESQLIGKNKIPDALYLQMRKAKVIEMLVPLEMRINRIVKEYACFPNDLLLEATRKLNKKLGNLRMNQAIEHLQQAQLAEWVKMMLAYYDKFYAYGMEQREAASISYFPLKDDFYSAQVNHLCENAYQS